MLSYLGYVAGALSVGAFLPQVVRAWRTRQTRDLSLASFLLLMTAGFLWIVYGAMSSDWPIVVTNGGMIALTGALAAAKVRFSK